jgi:hypothetical protein
VSTLDLGHTIDENEFEVENEVSACHDIYRDLNGDLVASDTCNHRIIKFVDGKFVAYSGVNRCYFLFVLISDLFLFLFLFFILIFYSYFSDAFACLVPRSYC